MQPFPLLFYTMHQHNNIHLCKINTLNSVQNDYLIYTDTMYITRIDVKRKRICEQRPQTLVATATDFSFVGVLNIKQVKTTHASGVVAQQLQYA